MNFNRLYNDDFFEILPLIPDGCVDMVLCDPPYGMTAAFWDKEMKWDSIWPQYWRILKPNGVVVLFAQMPFAAKLVCSQIKYFRYEWIWEKGQPTGFLNSKKMPLKAHEQLLVFYRKLPTYNLIHIPNQNKGKYVRICNNGRINKMEIYGNTKSNELITFKSEGERYPRDVIKFKTVNAETGFKKNGTTVHPVQKPTSLLRHMIQVYTNKNEVVLDNCMGSGSTCVAAVETERQFIGIEREKKYYDIACQRVEQARTISLEPRIREKDDYQLTLF